MSGACSRPSFLRSTRGKNRLRGAVLAGLLLLLTTGCAVQLAYDNVDRLARWFASDFVSMDESQRVQFDAGVAEVWAWHRRTHIPRYADFFDALPSVLADGTNAAEIEAIVNAVIEWALEIEQQSLPVTIELLTSLSDEQVGALRTRMAESNDEIAEDEREQTLEQSRREWKKQTASRFSRFSGRLTRAQDAYLAEQSARYLPDTVLWAEYRGRWQADLMQLLEHRSDRERFATGFRDLSSSRERYYGAELNAVWDNNRALAADVTAWLINSLSAPQRIRFNDELASLAAEFREISGADGATPTDVCGPVIEC